MNTTALIPLNACPVCGATDIEQTGSVEDRLWRQVPPTATDRYQFATLYNYMNRCRTCGVAFLSPRLRADALRELYARWYRQKGSCASPSPHSFARWRRNYLSVVRHSGSEGPLLDVGCGTGEFLRVAREDGWTAVGLEWDATAAERAGTVSGARIVRAQLSEADFKTESFGTVTMFDYLEHSMTPGIDLKRAVKLLRPGGTLIVRVPNLDSLCARLTGNDWGYLACVHLTYFTPTTLQRVLANQGLEEISVKATGHQRIADVMAARLTSLRVRLGRSRPSGIARDADSNDNVGRAEPPPRSRVSSLRRRLRAVALEQLDLVAGLVGRADVMVAVAKKPRDNE